MRQTWISAMWRWLKPLAVLLCLLVNAAPALASEAITDFHADLDLAKDGLLTVRETITVNAEADRIRHGIYRDIPLTFVDAAGANHKVDFTLLSVERDGEAEPYSTENADNGIRIIIGSADVTLDRGRHVYHITYETNRQMRYFDGSDELLWNVTGNGWGFPILRASATLTLPPGVAPLDTLFSTGPLGATGRNASVTGQNAVLDFATTRALAPQEGLTIGVKLAKGAIDSPTSAQQQIWFLKDHINGLIAFGGFLVVFLFYLWGWNRVGRDPPRGVIVPRWDAPDGLSPALVSYVDNKGFGGNVWTALSAACISLAVKGYVVLEDLAGTLTIRQSDLVEPSALPPGENTIIATLKRSGAPIKIEKSNGLAVKKLGEDFQSAIEKEHRGKYYHANAGYLTLGVLLSVATVVALFLFGNMSDETIGVLFSAGFSAVFISIFAINFGRRLFSGRNLLARVIGIVVLALAGVATILVFGTLFIAVIITLEESGQMPLLGAVTALFVTNILFFYLMGAPTPLGAKLMDGIDGMKQYLVLAEQDRMNMAGAPTMSPQHYEKLLPYAVALGLEKPWSNAFQTWLLAATASATATSYTPLWYTGHDFSPATFSNSMTGLSSSIATSLQSSLPDPPKSSDSGFSGGGGSSGSGGGGGGGGGW
jgi:uncharacterized membrane protein YgcG